MKKVLRLRQFVDPDNKGLTKTAPLSETGKHLGRILVQGQLIPDDLVVTLPRVVFSGFLRHLQLLLLFINDRDIQLLFFT